MYSDTVEGLLRSALQEVGGEQQQPFDWEVGYDTLNKEGAENIDG